LIIGDEGLGAQRFKYTITVPREFKILAHVLLYATDCRLETQFGNRDCM
jgi:hypothetical protein